MSFNLSKNIFGLDISEQKLRLIQIKKRGGNLDISSFNEILLEKDIIANGEIKNQKKMIAALQKLIKTVKGTKINSKNIVAVLPEQKTFVKVIEVNFKKDDLENQIKKEIQNHIPLELDELYLDWKILSQTDTEAQVLVGAIQKNISDSYFSVIKKAGLTPLVLEIEAIAITRAIIDKKKSEKDKKAKIIIDFGAARTGLIAYKQGAVQFTSSLPIAGANITETISKTLKIDLKKAEKAKIICGLDQKKCEGALLKILNSAVNNLALHIKKATTFYKSNFPGNNEISEIIICGGGANLNQIDKILSEKIGIPVTIGDPLVNFKKAKNIKVPQDKLLSYTTAIGLALRVWQKGKLI